MKQGDRIVLELTHEQAVVLQKAVELYFRINIGQFNEIKWVLRKHPNNKAEANTQCVNATLDMLRAVFFPTLERGQSFNVECTEDCENAYNLYQAVRYVNAWHENPEGGLGVNFDPPFPIEKPIPKCYLVEEGEDEVDG